MTGLGAHLVDLLALEPIEENLFRGKNTGEPRPRVFGGQVAGQALMAASLTAGELPVHSLHAYFLRPGNTVLPIDYSVDRVRDGRSFVTRLVTARQNDEVIFHMSASFHAAEAGMEHQVSMPQVPEPDACMTWAQWMKPWADKFPPETAKYMLRLRPIEMRPITPMDLRAPVPSGDRQQFWLRCGGPLPDDPRLHASIATYASDHTLLSVAMRPHGKTFMSRDLMAASLDHTMWFHRPFRMDDWILYDQMSPASASARGLAWGHFFTRDGCLVASMAQEGLMRPVLRSKKA